MLAYTGHPFVDVGVAVITAFVGKQHPSDLTPADLEAVAQYIAENYVKPPLKAHLTMAFTSNAWFSNPSTSAAKKTEMGTRHLTQWQGTAATCLSCSCRWCCVTRHLTQWQGTAATGDQCIFTGLPTTREPLSESLQVGRAGRAQVPGLQGDKAINFFAQGDPGIPISGIALLALQAFPLGCAKCGVGLLAVHADDPAITFRIARRFWVQNQQAIVQAQIADETKLPVAPRGLKTLLIETLLDVQHEYQSDERLPSITAYNFTNGQTAACDVYYLPLEVTGFLQAVRNPTYREAWQQLVHRWWDQPKGKKGQPAPPPRHNKLYEDLFQLPTDAALFMRRYLIAVRQPVSWSLIQLFLRKVVGMDKERIRQIEQLGDGLAAYVRTHGGKRFFRAFYTERKGYVLRGLLIKANLEQIRSGAPPLFDMHGYIEVFEEGEDVLRSDWMLARDLVLMRMIDQLQDWLKANKDVIAEEVLVVAADDTPLFPETEAN